MIKLNVSNLDNLKIHMLQWANGSRIKSKFEEHVTRQIHQMQGMSDALDILESAYGDMDEENKMYMVFWANLVQSGSEKTMKHMTWEEIKQELRILWAKTTGKLGDDGLEDVLRL